MRVSGQLGALHIVRCSGLSASYTRIIVCRSRYELHEPHLASLANGHLAAAHVRVLRVRITDSRLKRDANSFELSLSALAVAPLAVRPGPGVSRLMKQAVRVWDATWRKVQRHMDDVFSRVVSGVEAVAEAAERSCV